MSEWLSQWRKRRVVVADANRYTLVAMLLHWSLALLLMAQITLGLTMDRAGLDDSIAFSVFQTHRALGVMILCLAFMRLGWRLMHSPPVAGYAAGKAQALLASAVHGALYLGQFLAPLSGWVLASCSSTAFPISIFGWFDWPLLPIESYGDWEGAARALHHDIVWIFLGLIILHGLAALYHGVIRHDGVMSRMLPRWRA